MKVMNEVYSIYCHTALCNKLLHYTRLVVFMKLNIENKMLVIFGSFDNVCLLDSTDNAKRCIIAWA